MNDWNISATMILLSLSLFDQYACLYIYTSVPLLQAGEIEPLFMCNKGIVESDHNEETATNYRE